MARACLCRLAVVYRVYMFSATSISCRVCVLCAYLARHRPVISLFHPVWFESQVKVFAIENRAAIRIPQCCVARRPECRGHSQDTESDTLIHWWVVKQGNFSRALGGFVFACGIWDFTPGSRYLI